MAIKASNQMTIIDLTDGYSVVLSSEAYTFTGGIDAVSATQSTKTTVYAFCGSKQVSCSVGTVTCPTGLSVVSDGATPAPTLTITATTALKAGGTLELPITVDGDINITKKFAYSIAFKGTSGTSVTISSKEVAYAISNSGSTAPTTASDWSSTTIPTATDDKPFLWTRTTVTYSDKTSTVSYSVGYKGSDGDNGADAITLEVTSSNGIIFKNTAVATILTAHVYKAGTEVTGTALSALGTIKWYKDGGTTTVGTGQTLTVSAGDVTNQATYVAQLEG